MPIGAPRRLRPPDSYQLPTFFLPDYFDSLSELRRLYYSRWAGSSPPGRKTIATRCSCHDATHFPLTKVLSPDDHFVFSFLTRNG
jgi:hypothetical protein